MRIDKELLEKVTRIAVRMLDNVIDLSEYPIERVNTARLGNRRIGLGVMGFADMLIRLGRGYGTRGGRTTAELVMSHIQDAATDASEALAHEKSVFPNWHLSKFMRTGTPMRNAAVTTVAPTGTISMMFDVAGGLEPYFSLAYYYKAVLGGNVDLQYVNKHLRKALEDEGIFSTELMDKIIKAGSVAKVPEIPVKLRTVFATSMDISADDHILMQAAFQRECDNSISKTINFPNDATREDCLAGFIKAWQNGCKGCTVYRDGSRFLQVLNLNTTKDEGTSESDGDPTPKLVVSGSECPDCPATLVRSEGCVSCRSCGYSACERA